MSSKAKLIRLPNELFEMVGAVALASQSTENSVVRDALQWYFGIGGTGMSLDRRRAIEVAHRVAIKNQPPLPKEIQSAITRMEGESSSPFTLNDVKKKR